MSRKKRNHKGGFLHVVHPDCAGIDIGGSFHMVAVSPERDEEPVRKFEAFTDALGQLADWLESCSVKVVAMESTGVYWIPLYEILDRRGFEVHLTNPRATKQVSGRKSDVRDCEWIWQLMSYGLLPSAFRPTDEICVLRSYTRQRSMLIGTQTRTIQHLQKALVQMNLTLTTVLSDITGKTGMGIVRAIVAGERDGVRLAKLRDRRVKADESTLVRALTGHWREEHLYALGQALAHYDFLEQQLGDCDGCVLEVLSKLTLTPDTKVPPARKRFQAGHRTPQQREALRAALYRVLGVDLTAIPTIGLDTALTIAAEVGSDLSRFPNSQHFCSWTSLAPGTRISGGKALPGRSPRIVNRLGQALRIAATHARHSDSYIGAAHRARLARMEKAKAIKASAHHLARLVYAMLTRGEAYLERGVEAFETEHRERQLRALRHRAAKFGLILAEAA